MSPSDPAAVSSQTRVELADIFRAHGAELGPLTADQRRVVRAIVQCRTAALGGHAWCCEACATVEVSYNSCRDRHCPKCQWGEQQQWLRDREAELLPVPYFHTVFTVPHELHPLFLRNPEACLGLLFAAVNETLSEVAREPRNLGAQIGFVCVLHTWTQKLDYHPHIHCIVPGGGLDPQTMQWVASHPKFFLPVRVLSEVFRGKLLQKLERAEDKGELAAAELDAKELLRRAARKSWVVYSKRPFAGPAQVLRYLGRYTHRIAISNHRLVSLNEGQVSFEYRDRKDANQKKMLTLPAKELLRRFLLHVVPHRLVRIRYYGFLAQSRKTELLARCRTALEGTSQGPDASGGERQLPVQSSPGPTATTPSDKIWLCPHCHLGRLLLVGRLDRAELDWFMRGRSTLQ